MIPIVNCERIHQRFLPHKPYLSHQPHPFLESSKSGSLPSGGNEKLLSQNNDHEFAVCQLIIGIGINSLDPFRF
ncbi:unnamed protein product [Rhizophagus irregularis]|nr:unnamed protein product [Rhizophagus irregularis]